MTSIVVVSFNNLMFNRLCLESVLAGTQPGSYELIVIDNGSEDGTADYLVELAGLNPGIRIVLNSTNTGFAAAANQGLELAGGQVLLLLNNDVIVPPGWLPLLLRGLDEPGVGMVGPVTNRCGNEAQIDTRYSTFGEFLEYANLRAREHAGESRAIRMLTMFCVALRRDVYEAIGPLDERFQIGLFEDEDYSLRLRNAGHVLRCQEDVMVHHFGQASIGKLAVSGEYGKLFHANRERFEGKWKMSWRPHGRRPNPKYRDLVRRIRAVIQSILPAESTVLVVSKGDEDLLTVSGHTAWHFPQDVHGQYAGHYPENSEQAIEQLEQLKTGGAQFLLIPETMLWWLQYYTGFASHISANYRCIRQGEDCFIYQLTDLGPMEGPPEFQRCARVRGLDRLNRRMPTVVIPVCEAYEELKTCLEWLSDERHPRQCLVIDDSSSDRRIGDLLEHWSENREHAAYAVTARRLGPVAALNIGLKLAPGDVVILRPGSFPSPHWLESLSARAREGGVVATVSPRTGRGDDGSGTGGPEKCLLITRAAMRKVGFLDESRFEDEPGALSDFYRRAAACHFENRVDPETRLYPAPGVAGRGRRNTAAPDRPCVLAVMHSGGGGVLLATEDLLTALSPRFRCILLTTGRSHWSLYETLDGGFKMRRHYAFPTPWRLESAVDSYRLGVIEDICASFRVDLVNIHHLLGGSPEMIGFFRKLGLPVIFSFHDFYTLCPTSHLLDDRQRHCAAVCTEGEGECAVGRKFFSGGVPVLKHHYVHEHRSRMNAALADCAAFTAPSVTVADRLRHFPDFIDLSKLEVIPHGCEAGRAQLAAEPARAEPARVLCPGNLNVAKGLGMIEQLLKRNQACGRPFEYHFLGARWRGFRPEEYGGIHHGPYRRSEFGSRVEKIRPSFILLASICEETWSLTLSESWAAGVPVFASDLGAFRERIGANGGGWLFEAGNTEVFHDGMLQVLEDPAAWKRAVDSINRVPLESVGREARKYERLFRCSLPQRASARAPD
jgi:GT2 family glycosyltransferase/glycosyltransferase involved in cell wall biosynthesis